MRFHRPERGDHSCRQAYKEREVAPKPALQNHGIMKKLFCMIFFDGGVISRGKGLLFVSSRFLVAHRMNGARLPTGPFHLHPAFARQCLTGAGLGCIAWPKQGPPARGRGPHFSRVRATVGSQGFSEPFGMLGFVILLSWL